MIDLGTYKDRFAESGQRVLEHAVQESRRRDQNYIAVEHILNAIATEEGDLFNSTMRDLSLDPRSVKVLIEKRLENARYQNVNKGIRIAPETIELFKRAMERARAQGIQRSTVGPPGPCSMPAPASTTCAASSSPWSTSASTR